MKNLAKKKKIKQEPKAKEEAAPKINLEDLVIAQNERMDKLESVLGNVTSFLSKTTEPQPQTGEQPAAPAQSQTGNSTLTDLVQIASMLKDQPAPSTDQRLANLALENMSLFNKFILTKMVGSVTNEQPEIEHTTI
ncbi:hypothetical protein CMI37_27365 [Candidatus Pacearchaeota archaeon]|nr:hypothetical protein [Candidatus Pacearchaeota archaeon]